MSNLFRIINFICAGFISIGMTTIAAIAQPSELQSILETPFPYAASNVEITRVVSDIGSMSGVAVIADESLEGTISISNPRGTVADALASVSEQFPVVWWYDGAAVRIEAQSGMVSELISLGSTEYDVFVKELKAMDLLDPRFPMRPASSGEFIRIVAPSGYVAETEALLTEMNRARVQQVCSRVGKDGEKAEFIVAGLPVVLRGQDVRKR